jgi:excisionase family DNA binding protein
MARSPATKAVFTTKEIAGFLKVHPLTVVRYIREGKIPAFKIGNEWRFNKKQIEKWLKRSHSPSLEAESRHKEEYLL